MSDPSQEGRTSFQFWNPEVTDLVGPETCVFAALDAADALIRTKRDEAVRNAVMVDADVSALGIQSADIDVPRLTSDNIILPVVEAIVAAWSEPKITPFLATENGPPEHREKCVKVNKFIDGLFRDMKVHEMRRTLCRDALWTGAGVSQTFDEDGKVCHERALSFDLHIDPFESRYGIGTARTLYHFPLVSRERLYWRMKALGIKKSKLEKIREYDPSDNDAKIFGTHAVSDMIPFCQAWHLGEGGEPGKFFFGIRGTMFDMVDYEFPDFPFSWLYYQEPTIGVLSKPLVSRLWPIQKFYDETTESTLRAIKKMGQPHILTYEDSPIEVMTAGKNQEATIYKIKGNRRPESLNFQPINPQVEEFRRSLPALIMQREGVPEQWVTGQIPKWLKESPSGRAQDVAVDEGSTRLEPGFENLEKYNLDVGRKSLWAANRIPGYEVKSVVGTTMTRIRYEDVKLPDNEYVAIVHPANQRFRSLSSKFKKADEWLARGGIDLDEWRQFQEMPDVEARDHYKLAPRKLVQKNLEYIKKTGKTLEAWPTDPHEYVIQMGTEAANEVRIDETLSEQRRTEIYLAILEYVESAQERQAEIAAKAAGAANAGQAPAPGAEAMMAPEAMGMAPPDGMGGGGMPPEMGGGIPPEMGGGIPPEMMMGPGGQGMA